MRNQRIDVLNFDWVVNYLKRIKELTYGHEDITDEEKLERFQRIVDSQKEFERFLKSKGENKDE